MTELVTEDQATAPRLSDLSENQRSRLFARLQERIPAVWDAFLLDLEDESVVVVPSVGGGKVLP